MAPSNLVLWHSVEKTPVEQTKPITGKSYNGNSPKPHWLIMRATEQFGPCGIGWGFKILSDRVVDTATYDDGTTERMHYAHVQVWYMWGGQRGEVEHVGGTILSGKRNNGKTFTDDDAPKKSVTDAVVKALSLLGFAGDIFLGRYDDSKYMAELKSEARESAEAAKSAPRAERASPARDNGRPATKAPDRKSTAHEAAAAIQAPYSDFDPADEPATVPYTASNSKVYNIEVGNAVDRLWKACESPEVSDEAFDDLLRRNEKWMERHAKTELASMRQTKSAVAA